MSSPAILITGSARRIGRVIACTLAQAGYEIALHYHHSRADAEQTQSEIQALGRRAELFQADLTEWQACPTLIKQAYAAFPGLCGLIHNASIFRKASFAESNPSDLQQHMQLHVTAPYALSQAYATQIGRGVIISLLDSAITRHAQQYFPYLLSKKALADLTHMLAKTLAPAIRVHGVAPGLTTLSDDIEEHDLEAKVARLPLAQLATPEAIADAVRYLVQADYLTGQLLYVDGGEQLG